MRLDVELYDLVVERGDWTSREQAAEATGIERATAAHHLDKLADEGLLEIDYQRLSGRSGPGAGRPAKVYRRAADDLAVSLPPRDYRLAGAVLAAAADRARLDGTDIADAIDAEARSAGQQLAAQVAERLEASPPSASYAATQALLDVLIGQGFEPERTDDGTVILRNCPFHQLASQHAELICGMNLSMLTAALHGVQAPGLRASLEPEPGQCCVRFRTVG